MTLTSNSNENDRYGYAPGHGTGGTESSLKIMDTIGGMLAAFMTLGPLAATALFAH